MNDPRLSGLLLVIPLVIIGYILLMLDRHYFSNRITNLFKQPKFRLLFMALIFISIILSSIFWRTYVGI